MTRAMFLVVLGACSGTKPTTGTTGDTGDTGTTTTTSTGDTGTTTTGPTVTTTPDGCPVFELGLYCFNTEDGGPSQTTGTCPTPTIADLMAGATSAPYPAPYHARCTDPVHGTLDYVNVPTGYGGPYYYFDSTDTFVAYKYSTDINVYCDGEAFSVWYGLWGGDCTSACAVDDPTGYSGLPPCP